MFNLSYDLHIHSCLSPCGDDDSTPSNIVGMAAIKGLDVIALTDHNSCRNTPAAKKTADEYGVIFIPGMELTTAEEVHVLCLFETVEAALDWDRFVYDRLIKIRNKAEIFGNQILYNESDEITGYEENLMINATTISFGEVYSLVHEYDGIMIPSHLEKSSTSLISNLGMIPEDSQFKTVEVNHLDKLHELKRNHPYVNECRIICDSDAHRLVDIREPELTIPVCEKTPEAVLDYLRGL